MVKVSKPDRGSALEVYLCFFFSDKRLLKKGVLDCRILPLIVLASSALKSPARHLHIQSINSLSLWNDSYLFNILFVHFKTVFSAMSNDIRTKDF